MNKPFEVEFVGLPGTGKSTVAREVLGMIGRNGLSRWQYEERVGKALQKKFKPFRPMSAALFGVTHPKLSLALSRYEARMSDFDRGGVERGWQVLRMFHGRSLVDLSDVETLVFDQGIVQAVWAMGRLRRSPHGTLLTQVMDALSSMAPDLLVRVSVPNEVSTARIQERVQRRGAEKGAQFEEEGGIFPAMFSRAEAELDVIVQQARLSFRVPVLDLDGEADPKENAEKVLEFAKRNVPQERLPF